MEKCRDYVGRRAVAPICDLDIFINGNRNLKYVVLVKEYEI